MEHDRTGVGQDGAVATMEAQPPSGRLQSQDLLHWEESVRVLDALGALRKQGVSAALATVVATRGSAYRIPGAKLLVDAHGHCTGNISGGCLELDVREVAARVIRTGEWEPRIYSDAEEKADWFAVAAGCGGAVELWVEPAPVNTTDVRAALQAGHPFQVSRKPGGEWSCGAIARSSSRLEAVPGGQQFIEVYRPPPRLWICGSGDDVVPLARLARNVGLAVTVIDRRPGLLRPDRFAKGVVLRDLDAKAVAATSGDGFPDLAVIMTHHLQDDADYLDAIAGLPVQYIGLLGSKSRVARLVAEADLKSDPRVFGPVGLDIAAAGAEQIAVAIVAELLAVLRGRDGGHLRDRDGGADD